MNDRYFEEDDVKLLLIEIREHLRDENFLREICDFVAHPKRTKGICHSRVDSRYAKMKFMKQGSKKITDNPDFIKENKDKPWSFFSNIILDYINVDEIPKQLFEIIIIEGIREISEDTFRENLKLGKNEILKFLKNSYFKKSGNYVLKNNLSIEEKSKIDNIIKFIQGTISGKPAFDQLEIEKQLISSLNRIQIENGYKRTFIQPKTLKELILCILCLLHYAIFELFDGERAVSYLFIDKIGKKKNEAYFNLYADAKGFIFPVITTNLKVKDFVGSATDIYNFEKIENQVYAERKNKKQLILMRHWA